jgi:hypothetical protein
MASLRGPMRRVGGRGRAAGPLVRECLDRLPPAFLAKITHQRRCENAFDEHASFPLPRSGVGEDVEVMSVGQSNGRRELIATSERAGHSRQLAPPPDIAIPRRPVRLVLTPWSPPACRLARP